MNRVNAAANVGEFMDERCSPLYVIQKFRTKTSRALF